MWAGLLKGPNETELGVIGRARQHGTVERTFTRMRGSRIEALQASRHLGHSGFQGLGERFIDWVVTDDPGVIAKVVGYRFPDPDVLSLKIPDDVIGPEMFGGGDQARVVVGVRPSSRQRADRIGVSAHRPRRCTFTPELRT